MAKKKTPIKPDGIRTAIAKAIGDVIMQHEPSTPGQNDMLSAITAHIQAQRKSHLAKLESARVLIAGE